MTESQRKNAESQRKTPDREKAIRGLETCSHADEVGCDQCPYYGTQGERGCQSAMQMDALALLREQKPVKPVVDTRDGWYRCGECGNSLASGERVRSFGSYKWPVYCEMCGRKVDWDA